MPGPLPNAASSLPCNAIIPTHGQVAANPPLGTPDIGGPVLDYVVERDLEAKAKPGESVALVRAPAGPNGAAQSGHE
jgi:hypothetical protein